MQNMPENAIAASGTGERRQISLAVSRRHDPFSRAGRILACLYPCKPARLNTDKPIVSFTFDDVPHSAVTNGARILSNHGHAGTFYLSAGLHGASTQLFEFYRHGDVETLLRENHEIACHTHGHPDLQTVDGERLRAEFDDNTKWFSQNFGIERLVNFAYPYGSTGLGQKRHVAQRFRSGRGVRPGIIRGWTDLAQLPSMQLYDRCLDRTRIDAMLARLADYPGWLIFYTHDVEENPSKHGCSPGLLKHAVEAAEKSGCQILSVDQALDRLSVK